MDLDDLFDDPVPSKTVAQKKSKTVTKFTAQKDDFDDFDDSYDLDNILGE